jgi:hypothetical protein
MIGCPARPVLTAPHRKPEPVNAACDGGLRAAKDVGDLTIWRASFEQLAKASIGAAIPFQLVGHQRTLAK